MLTTVLLAASMVVGQAEEASPGAEMLKRFAKEHLGTWVQVSDQDGPIDESRRAVATWEWAIENTSYSLSHRGKGEDGTDFEVKALVAWDGSENVLRAFAVISESAFGQATYEIRGGKWFRGLKIVAANGRTDTSESTLTITDNGNTHIWQHANRISDGKPQPDGTGTWKRVKK